MTYYATSTRFVKLFPPKINFILHSACYLAYSYVAGRQHPQLFIGHFIVRASGFCYILSIEHLKTEAPLTVCKLDGEEGGDCCPLSTTTGENWQKKVFYDFHFPMDKILRIPLLRRTKVAHVVGY